MKDGSIQKERAANLWGSFARKFDPVARASALDPDPDLELYRIGGLSGPKDEIATYACAATSPDVYERWGTFPPTGLLLIGSRGVGKRMLARSLATLTNTPSLEVDVPRLVLEVIHRGGKVGDLVSEWSQTLSEMPPLTVLFNELEFFQAEEIGTRRPDLPVGPVMDFLLDLVDRTIAIEQCQVVGATSHPDVLRQAFTEPRRFERIVEVSPTYPDDIVAALVIHSSDAEKRAGHALFDAVDWNAVVRKSRKPSTGDWIRIMHGALRRKARCEAGGEVAKPVTTSDLLDEVSRFERASDRLAVVDGGTYV